MTPSNWWKCGDESCARRNVGTASVFAGGCAFMVLGCWNGLHKPQPIESGVFDLFFQGFGLFIVTILFIEFRCVRERLVLGLAMVDSVRTLCVGINPGMTDDLPRFWNRSELILWMGALVVSLTMLASALQARKAAVGADS